MNANEIRELLHRFADGELGPAEEDKVRAILAESPEYQQELDEIQAIRALTLEAFEAPVADVDFGGFYEAVMARVEAEEGASIVGVPIQREADAPGLLDRIAAWLGELFRLERPLTAMATAAALVAVVAGLWMARPGAGPSVTPGPGPVAAGPQLSPSPEAPPSAVADNGARRRQAHTEGRSEYGGRNAARVESWEAVAGRVEIEDNAADPDAPIVVWHIDEEAAPEGQEL